jgi:predicted small metal-binding protein
MAEVSIKCPQCGMEIHGPDEEGLARNFKEHTHEVHSMEMSEEEAKKKVKMMLEE